MTNAEIVLAFVALTSLFSAILTAVLLLWVRKLRRDAYAVASEVSLVKKEADQVYRQLEALQSLYRMLSFDHPLPPLRGWAASPDFLLVLSKHVLQARPKVILECSSGSSTIVLARCLQIIGRGRLLSLEHDPHYASQTRSELERHGLSAHAVVIDAPLVPHELDRRFNWYSLGDKRLSGLQGAVDLLVIDGPPAASGDLARYPALPLLSPLLADDCSVFLDDYNRADERETVSRWLSQNPEYSLIAHECEKGCAQLRRCASSRGILAA